eukprot:scaffold13491_cov113-Isochrysis_galbana.AAC.1
MGPSLARNRETIAGDTRGASPVAEITASSRCRKALGAGGDASRKAHVCGGVEEGEERAAGQQGWGVRARKEDEGKA